MITITGINSITISTITSTITISTTSTISTIISTIHIIIIIIIIIITTRSELPAPLEISPGSRGTGRALMLPLHGRRESWTVGSHAAPRDAHGANKGYSIL